MCLGQPSPSVPTPPPAPQTPQDPQLSDLTAARKARMAASGMPGGLGAGTLLTGSSGIENSQLNTGKGSLLGS